LKEEGALAVVICALCDAPSKFAHYSYYCYYYYYYYYYYNLLLVCVCISAKNRVSLSGLSQSASGTRVPSTSTFNDRSSYTSRSSSRHATASLRTAFPRNGGCWRQTVFSFLGFWGFFLHLCIIVPVCGWFGAVVTTFVTSAKVVLRQARLILGLVTTFGASTIQATQPHSAWSSLRGSVQ